MRKLYVLCLFMGFFGELWAQNKPFYPVHKRKKYTDADSLRGALRPERTCFDVVYYDLKVEVIPKKKSLIGVSTVHFIGP